MGMNDAVIQMLIKAQDQTGGAFSSLQQNMKKTEQSTTAMSAVTSIFSGVAVAGMIDQLQKAGIAAREHETSITRLASSVDANGGSWKANREEIEKMLATRRRFGYSDNELIDSLNTLTIETGDYNEAIIRQRAAINLARGANIDLSTASRLLGKVTDENANQLKRMGISVEKGASAEELLAKVYERTGNAAEAQTKTMAVRSEVFRNTVERIYETIGSSSSAIQAVAAAGPLLKNGLGAATTAITFFSRETVIAGEASTAAGRALERYGAKAVGLIRILGPAGIIAVGVKAGGEAFMAFARAFSRPGSEGDKMVEAFDKFGDASTKAGGGAGGFFSALGSTYHDAILAGGATNVLTSKLVEFLKEQDKAPKKQEALTTAIKNSASAFDTLSASQKKLFDALAGPSGQVSAKTSQSTAIGALSGVFGGEEKIPPHLLDIVKRVATDTMGATEETIRKKLGDEVYKIVEDAVSSVAVKDLEGQIKAVTADRAVLETTAKEAGMSASEFLAFLNGELKRARDNQKILADELKAELQGAGLHPLDGHDMSTKQMTAIKHIHDQRDALAEIPPKHNEALRKMLEIEASWGSMIALAQTYGAVISGQPAPKRLPAWTIDPTTGNVVDNLPNTNSPDPSIPRALGGVMWPGHVYSLGEQNRREYVSAVGVGGDGGGPEQDPPGYGGGPRAWPPHWGYGNDIFNPNASLDSSSIDDRRGQRFMPNSFAGIHANLYDENPWTGAKGGPGASPPNAVNYGSEEDLSAAANAAQTLANILGRIARAPGALDSVTEALRQQSRRVGRRASPFGAI